MEHRCHTFLPTEIWFTSHQGGIVEKYGISIVWEEKLSLGHFAFLKMTKVYFTVKVKWASLVQLEKSLNEDNVQELFHN